MRFLQDEYMTKKVFTVFLIAAIISVISCSRERQTSKEIPEEQSRQRTAVRMSSLDQDTKDYLSGKNIILILGYGYNDELSSNTIIQLMDLNYGVETEEKEGLISCLIYPDDFMRAGRIRVSSLIDLIEDKTPAGIIIIGAPEGISIPLSRLQDSEENGRLPYPVFSFFSQEDILAGESTADFVVDYALKTNNMEAEETSYIPDFDVPDMLLNAVQTMISLREPLPADTNLMPTVQKIIGKERTVKHYFDTETGLMSVNHFIFE